MESTINSCPFCAPPVERVFQVDSLTIGLWDGYPVSPGHALIVPRRHVPSWFDTSPAERAALIDAIDRAKAEIERAYNPTGFNVGINIGASAGQTIFHLHVHLIPRYDGDVADPRGGVRYVIPRKANYLLRVEDSKPRYSNDADKLLWTGGNSEPFKTQLLEHLATAARADIAVAFVMKSGIDLLRPAISEALNRGTRIRLLTGDYLDATDPEALIQLLDFDSESTTIELRVYQTHMNRGAASGLPTAFHPKAYLFEHHDGSGTAFIGSSNLSKSALTDGVEWNYRILSSRDGQGYAEARSAFNDLFSSRYTTTLSKQWIEDYKSRRVSNLRPITEDAVTTPPPERAEPPKPHAIQREALEALELSRQGDADAGLVVLATGLGKTWLSAFDSINFKRVLFVAHRDEILDQAMQTFRRIRPGDYLGKYDGDAKHPNADVLFASIQTLSRQAHLDRFGADHFDYIIVDEFHHASAATYRRLLRHFRPRYLLGLTATPERSDGADLLELCGGNLVYRCDLSEGIGRQLLCTFDYFGVPDEVDYTNIPWRSARFDDEELTTAVATVSRAENALKQLAARGGKRTLAFCVSQRHAAFMAAFFVSKGIRAVAVHAGPNSAPRTLSLERLQSGELDVVCAVDMFNEGVDMPDLDTVMMLRPTESKILWLQQFGRGLRRSSPEKRLKVIDYIGNHRTFLLKPQTLFNLPAGDRNIQNLLEKLQAGTAELPPGCSVTYDLETIDILKGLLRVSPSDSDALKSYVKDFIATHGVRPTALEAFRDGYAPRSVRRNYGSWFAFLQAIGALDSADTLSAHACTAFLESLESTPMTRSFKMVALLGMLNADRFPGSIELDDLVSEVRRLGHSQSKIAADFGEDFVDTARLRASLESNPINAWTGGAGTSEERYFEYVGRSFRTKIDIPDSSRTTTQSLVREIAEWRLAEYFDRSISPKPGSILIKVNQSNGNPILMPLERERHPSIPEGTTPFIANGQRYSGNFAKIALNAARKDGSDRNELPGILRTWFGPDAGAPGTRHQVELSLVDGNWTIAPNGLGIVAPVMWKSYSREQIPGLFGLEFNAPVWQQGFVRRGSRTFLLVTLDKTAAASEHKYQDRFLSADEFEWQSQNRTAQASKDGDSIRSHESMGIEVLLFVRTHSKTKQGKASPFFYCGAVKFQDWHGDKPITVRWRLHDEVPARLREDLRVP